MASHNIDHFIQHNRQSRHETANWALMTIYQRLYLKAIKEEQRRIELAGGDQAEIPTQNETQKTDGRKDEG